MSRRDQVVIVGAGLAGLVTALELTEHGVDCVVLEAAARPGGRVGTFTFPDGALAEAHLEEIWEGSPAFPLLARLGLRWREHETASSVMVDGVLHPYRRGDDAGYLEQLLGPEREAFLAFHQRLSTLHGDLDAAQAEGRWTPALERLMTVSLAAFVVGAGLGPRATAWLRIVVEAETAIEWDRIAALDGVAELRPFLLDGDGRPRERNVSVVGGNERLIDALGVAPARRHGAHGCPRRAGRRRRTGCDRPLPRWPRSPARGRRPPRGGDDAGVDAAGARPGPRPRRGVPPRRGVHRSRYLREGRPAVARAGRAAVGLPRRRALDAAHRRRRGVRLRAGRRGRTAATSPTTGTRSSRCSSRPRPPVP